MMTGRDVGILACRLMAIYALLYAFAMLSAAMSMFQLLSSGYTGARVTGFGPVLALAPFLAALVTANILWVKAERIAYRLVPYPSPQPTTLELSVRDLQGVALSVI